MISLYALKSGERHPPYPNRSGKLRKGGLGTVYEKNAGSLCSPIEAAKTASKERQAGNFDGNFT
jgi:hypothetical protein